MSHPKSTATVVGTPTAAAPALPERQLAAWRSYLMYLTGSDAARVATVTQEIMQDAQAAGQAEFAEDPLVWLFTEGRKAVAGTGQRGEVRSAGASEENSATEGEDPRIVVHQAIQRLTPKQQEALRLKFQFGFNLEEIARITGLTNYGAGGLLHLAVSRIGQAICVASGTEFQPLDDQRLTAYALDELDGGERKAFAEGVPNGKALFESAEVIRGWCGQIGQVLESGAQLPKRRRKGVAWWKTKPLWLGLVTLLVIGGGVYFFKPESEVAARGRALTGANGIGSMPTEEAQSAERLRGAVGDTGAGGPLVGEDIRQDRNRRKTEKTKPVREAAGSAADNSSDETESSPGTIEANGGGRGGRETKSRGAPTGVTSKARNPAEARGQAGEIEATWNEPTEPTGDAQEISPKGESESSVSPESGSSPATKQPAKPAVHRPLSVQADQTVNVTAAEEKDSPDQRKPATMNPLKPGPGDLKRQLARKRWPSPAEVSTGDLLKHAPPSPPNPGQLEPVEAQLEQAPAPRDPAKRIVRVSLRAKDAPSPERPTANLVFAIDVSQSMAGQNRLPLVQDAVRRLVDRLRPDDRVSIVTYADKAAVVLAATPVSQGGALRSSLAGLETSGLTNGSEGLLLAYAAVRDGWIEGGLNEVVLCTDGNFNLGTTGETELAAIAAEHAKSGVRLSVFGFGRSDRNDLRLEMLAQSGGGRSCYVNTREEAECALVEQINGLFAPVANDVQMQVEFNPALVADARRLDDESNGVNWASVASLLPGRSLTAMYEITPRAGVRADAGPLARLQVAYARTGTVEPEQSSMAVAGVVQEWPQTAIDFRYATAMMEFARILRAGPVGAGTELARLDKWVDANLPDDTGGYRNELKYLLEQAGAAAAQER